MYIVNIYFHCVLNAVGKGKIVSYSHLINCFFSFVLSMQLYIKRLLALFSIARSRFLKSVVEEICPLKKSQNKPYTLESLTILLHG